MSETFTITLPISEAQADMAGLPRTWLERAIRAVGVPVAAQPWPYPPIGFGTLTIEYCECEAPMIRCDTGGCRCVRCGKHERVWVQNDSSVLGPSHD